MCDSTLKDIKNGKGLEPLNSSSDSPKQSGITTEQRGDKGIFYETASDHSKEKK